jgi:hypothetical protein
MLKRSLLLLFLSIHTLALEYNPVANVLAQVFIGRTRVTLLTSNLIRLEVSINTTNPMFDDRVTTAIVNRNLPVPAFTVNRINSTAAIISTSSLTITYVDGNGGRDSMCSSILNETDAVDPTRSTNYPNGVLVNSINDCCDACKSDPSCSYYVYETASVSANVNGTYCFPLSSTGGLKTNITNRVLGGLTGGNLPSGSSLSITFGSTTWTPSSIDTLNLNGTYHALDCYSTPMQCNDEYENAMPSGLEWNNVDINNPLIQDAVKDTQLLQQAHDFVNPSFKLASCGWTVGPLGARWYYDTVLPSTWTISSIDMDVGNTPVDPAYANITHRSNDQKWAIPWAEDDPGLTAPELWVNRSLSHARDAHSYGVGGLLSIHWRTRMTSPQIASAHASAWNISLQASDFWLTFVLGQFNDPTVSSSAALIFESIESFNLPRPVNWIGGPGGLSADASKCNFISTYAFVDSFVSLRPQLLAAIQSGTATLNNLERFDYWAGQFVYMRQIAKFECDWATYVSVISSINKITDPTQKQQAARTLGVPARISLQTNATIMVQDLLSTVSTIEGSGTIYNLISHGLWGAIGPSPTAELVALTGEPLPTDALPPTSYDPLRPPQLRVQTVRTMLASDEQVNLRAIVIVAISQMPTAVTLFSAPLGSSTWTSTTLHDVIRFTRIHGRHWG